MQEVFEKIIERLRLSEYNHAICGKDMAIDTETAVQIVEDAYNEYNNGWIPCSEKMPEKATNVLVTQDFGGYKNVTEASYLDNLCGKNFWCCYDHKINSVVAWKPLPQPYKAN